MDGQPVATELGSTHGHEHDNDSIYAASDHQFYKHPIVAALSYYEPLCPQFAPHSVGESDHDHGHRYFHGNHVQVSDGGPKNLVAHQLKDKVICIRPHRFDYVIYSNDVVRIVSIAATFIQRYVPQRNKNFVASSHVGSDLHPFFLTFAYDTQVYVFAFESFYRAYE